MSVIGHQRKQRDSIKVRGLHCLRFVPMVLVMGTIFFLSAQPGDSLSLPDIPNIDKLLHAGIYGLLAATIMFAVQENRWHTRPCMVGISVVIFCLLYGLSDEWHQSFVPGRTPDILDIAADTFGAATMILLWFQYPRCIKNRTESAKNRMNLLS